jgi:hypothetical protein
MVAVGRHVCKCEAEKERRGRRAGNPKPRVSGLLYQMVMERDSGWWWGSLYNVTAALGYHVCHRKVGERVREPKI